MGCRIGKRTIVASPMQAFDWNAVSFGSDCVVDGVLQLHTFENMMLKVKRTDIRDGCAISFGATVMGGAVIEPGTTVLPLSMVLKEMHLPTATYWGSPTEPAIEAQHTFPLLMRPGRGLGHPDLPGEAGAGKENTQERITAKDE
jgi:hypothetical protein